MRIAVNCLNLDPTFVGGLTTFTTGLLKGLASVSNGHHFQIYATTANKHLFESLRSRGNFHVVDLPHKQHACRRGLCRLSLLSLSNRLYESTSNKLFRPVRDMMEANTDLTYTPSVVLQSFDSRKPTVLSMHDIQHVHYPQFFSYARQLSRKISYGLSARYATFLQASSTFIKEDLLRHFACLQPEQIEVIPEGVDLEDFRKSPDPSALRDRYALPQEFLLYPAQLWPHKNHMALLKALKHIESEHNHKVPLVLTGAKYSAAASVLGYIHENSMNYVHYLGKIPRPDLLALYREARFVVVPSFHESSSLPILEAAASGTPIIASRIPPNHELAQSIAMNLFDPNNEYELAELIRSLWNDTSTLDLQVQRNYRQIVRYSWKRAASRYLSVFEKALAA